jgi:hypothetical protein
MLRVAGRKRRNANEEVEAVLAEADHVEPAAIRRQEVNRQSHAAHATTGDPAHGG